MCTSPFQNKACIQLNKVNKIKVNLVLQKLKTSKIFMTIREQYLTISCNVIEILQSRILIEHHTTLLREFQIYRLQIS